MKGTKNTSKKLLSLLLIGNSASGKTAIISSFDGEISKNHCQTIGNDFSFKKLVISDGNTKESIDVKIWDSAGTDPSASHPPAGRSARTGTSSDSGRPSPGG